MSSIKSQLYWTTVLIPTLQVVTGVISAYNYATYDVTVPDTTTYMILHSIIIAVCIVLAVSCAGGYFISYESQQFLRGIHREAVSLGLIGSALEIAMISQFKLLSDRLVTERWPCESGIIRSVAWNSIEIMNMVLMILSVSLLSVHAIVIKANDSADTSDHSQ